MTIIDSDGVKEGQVYCTQERARGEASLAEAKTQCEEVLRNAAELIACAEQAVRQAAAHEAACAAKVAEAKSYVAKIEGACQAIQSEIGREESRKSALEAQRAGLYSRASALEAMIERLKAQIARLKAQIATMPDTITRRHKNSDGSYSTTHETNHAKNAARAELAQLEAELAPLEAELWQCLLAIAKVEADLAVCIETIQCLGNKLSHIQRLLGHAHSHLSTVEGAYKQAVEQHQSACSALDATRSDCANEVAKAEATVAKSESTLGEMKRILERAEQAYHQAESEIHLYYYS